MLHHIHHTYKKHTNFWNRERYISLFWALLLFILALFFQKFADNYVVETGGTPVADVILSNIPTLHIEGLIIFTTLVFTFVVIILAIMRPEYMLFLIKALSLFVITRGFFIMLTHLGAHPDQLVFSENNIGFFLYDLLYNTRNDFFFSGHTGIPFLMFLIFYRERFWRYVFLATSITFGCFVLIGHMHYSIDVFAAPFMTYSIFSIAKVLAKKDYHLIENH